MCYKVGCWLDNDSAWSESILY